ncbi:MAG: arginine deiminase family protein, partial [Gammaproteobacteria bacterium]
ERTNRAGVRRLADALAALDAGPRWLVIVKLPARRAYMHLDTVMTPVDRDATRCGRPAPLPFAPAGFPRPAPPSVHSLPVHRGLSLRGSSSRRPHGPSAAAITTS